jgi:hypothetical protein
MAAEYTEKLGVCVCMSREREYRMASGLFLRTPSSRSRDFLETQSKAIYCQRNKKLKKADEASKKPPLSAIRHDGLFLNFQMLLIQIYAIHLLKNKNK